MLNPEIGFSKIPINWWSLQLITLSPVSVLLIGIYIQWKCRKLFIIIIYFKDLYDFDSQMAFLRVRGRILTSEFSFACKNSTFDSSSFLGPWLCLCINGFIAIHICQFLSNSWTFYKMLYSSEEIASLSKYVEAKSGDSSHNSCLKSTEKRT